MNRAEPLGRNLILCSRLKSKCLHIWGFYLIQIFRLKIQTKKAKLSKHFFFKLYLYCRVQHKPQPKIELSLAFKIELSLTFMRLSVKFLCVTLCHLVHSLKDFMCYLVHSLTVTGSTQPSLSGLGKSKNTLWTFVIICQHCRLCVYESETFVNCNNCKRRDRRRT